jgi:hypothetical protein
MPEILKEDKYRNRALLDAARDKPCMNCGAHDGTVVPAHSNLSEHGKGARTKAHDCFVAWLCGRCHTWLDQGSGRDPTNIWEDTRADKREMFLRAMHKTILRLFQLGILEVTCRRG